MNNIGGIGSAICALYHNNSMIKKAESIIQQLAESENCRLYLIQPDGSRIRIQPGCKIESYEFVCVHLKASN